MTLACVAATLAGLAQPADAFDLDARVDLAAERLADTTRAPAFTLEFLLADVRPRGSDPRRFYNFSGDLSGRYLEVMSLLDDAAPVSLAVLADSLLAYQRPDGRFGDPTLRYVADEIGGEHMALLWGNGRLLVGLMTYYEQTGDTAVLAAAERLGDFFVATADACRAPAAVARLEGFGAKGIICFTQYIEGLVMLARATEAPRFRRAAVDAYTVLPPRGIQHSHGYLSTLRGVLDLYRLTGDTAHLGYVRRTTDDLLASDDRTIYGAVFEYFGGHGDRDEGCSSADFVRLALGLHHVTGDAAYRRAGEEALVNALLYNQYASGDFGHHYFADDGTLAPSNPRRSWWCCTMHGLRALIAVRDEYAFAKTSHADADPTTYEFTLLVPHAFGASAPFAGGLRREVLDGGRWGYTLTAAVARPLALEIPLPDWAEDWRVESPSAEVSAVITGVASVVLPEGDHVVTLSAHPRIAYHPGQGRAEAPAPETPEPGYLTYGPYVVGARADVFVAEPDWANQVDYTTLEAAPDGLGVRGRFHHAGYPGTHEVTFVPVATQPAAGHPYMRVVTDWGKEPAPRSPDE